MATPSPTDPSPRLIDTPVGPMSIATEGPTEAPMLFCIHGLPGSHRDFRYLAPLLAAHFHVVRLEMPGFGQSPPGVDSVAGWAEAVHATSTALRPSRLILLSHSFGSGAVLLAASAIGSPLQGLVLLAPMGLRRHRAFLLPPSVNGLQAGLMTVPAFRGALYRTAVLIYRKIGLLAPEDWTEVRRHLRLLASVDFSAFRTASRTIAVPVLLAHCADDALVQTAIPRELAAALPRAELIELENGGHHLQKTRPREIAAAVTGRFAG